jgi:hypothetical protein
MQTGQRYEVRDMYQQLSSRLDDAARTDGGA